jgi:hypothetical protein
MINSKRSGSNYFYFEVLSQDLRGVIEENHKNVSQNSHSSNIFKPGTAQLQSRSTNHYTAIFGDEGLNT